MTKNITCCELIEKVKKTTLYHSQSREKVLEGIEFATKTFFVSDNENTWACDKCWKWLYSHIEEQYHNFQSNWEEKKRKVEEKWAEINKIKNK
jgi:hypothetical protein